MGFASQARKLREAAYFCVLNVRQKEPSNRENIYRSVAAVRNGHIGIEFRRGRNHT